MYREVPIPLVRSSQILLIVGTILAPIFQAPWMIYVLFIMFAHSYFFGPRTFLPFIIAKPIFGSRLMYSETEAAEQLRFNQLIAWVFLGLSSLVLATTGHWFGYVFSGLVTLCAGMAVGGFCIGCWLYLRLKMRIFPYRSNPKFKKLLEFFEGTGDFTPRLLDVPQPLLFMGLAHVSIRKAIAELQQLAAKDDRFPELAERVRAFVRCMEYHAKLEDDIMYPRLESRILRGVSERFANEHEEVEALEQRVIGLLFEAERDTERIPAAREAILVYTHEMSEHLTREEDQVQKWVPYLVSIRTGASIVHHMLHSDTEEFLSFHASYIFSYLQPGQQYTYTRILHGLLSSEMFDRLAPQLKEQVSPRHWADFIHVFSKRKPSRKYMVAKV